MISRGTGNSSTHSILFPTYDGIHVILMNEWTSTTCHLSAARGIVMRITCNVGWHVRSWFSVVYESSWSQTRNTVVMQTQRSTCIFKKHPQWVRNRDEKCIWRFEHNLRQDMLKSSSFRLPLMKIHHFLLTVAQRTDLGKLSLHSLPFSRHPLGVTLLLKLKNNNRRVCCEPLLWRRAVWK